MISIKARSGLYLLILLFTFPGGCEKSEVTSIFSVCDQKTVVDRSFFESGPLDRMDIQDVVIERDGLRIKSRASGCNSESWKVELVGSEYATQTLPADRDIRLSLDSEEEGLPYLGKEISFDMTIFKAGSEDVILLFYDSEHQIRYT